MQSENYFDVLKSKFATGLRWTFSGSIIFEASHILHNMFLLYFIGSSRYGLFGSFFSIVYLVIQLVDLGFESSLAPFLSIVTQNKKTFKKVFPLYILPQFFFLFIGSFVAFYFYKTLFFPVSHQLPSLFFLSLILLEGLRIFLRRFLHNVFFNRATVLVEQIFIFAYYAMIWIPVILFSWPLSLKLVFIPYFINTTIVTIIFLFIVSRYYVQLSDTHLTVPPRLWKRIIKTRYYNYLINIETFLISGNFLVPFFATTFGLHQAGLFKIATIVAHSIKALVKSAIHFPGTALLASVKDKSLKIKKEAFYTLSHKLNHIVLFAALFLMINYNFFSLFHPTTPTLRSAWLYAFIFISITLIHQLFVVYEQFYIIEELANKLFIIKSIEFILFYILIIANKHITPMLTLVNIGLIQLLCFSILATHAYARWKIKPYFRVKFSFLIFTLVTSVLFFLVAHLLNPL